MPLQNSKTEYKKYTRDHHFPKITKLMANSGQEFHSHLGNANFSPIGPFLVSQNWTDSKGLKWPLMTSKHCLRYK